MAAAALRVVRIIAAPAPPRVCVSSSSAAAASSLPSLRGNREAAWNTTYPSRVHTIWRRPRYQKLALMSISQSPPGFREEMEAHLALVKMKCAPCSSKDLRPMGKEAAETLMQQIPGWDLLDGDGHLELQRKWKVKNFMRGLEFMQQIGDIAESEGHHPDLHLINWNDVKVNIWTHAIGGLTENDFIIAAKINALNMDAFLRKKAPKPAVAT